MANSLFQSFRAVAVNDNLTVFVNVVGPADQDNTEAVVALPMTDAGTFSNGFIYVPTNTASNTSTITLRKSGADTALIISVTGDGTGIFENTSDTETFAATDTVNWEVTVPTEAGGNTLTLSLFGVQFAPTTATDSVTMLAQEPFNVTSASDTGYLAINTVTLNNGTGVESRVQTTIRGSFTQTNLYVYVATNARTTDTTFGNRKNTANGSMSVTFGSGETGGKEDTSNSDGYTADDLANYYFTTSTGTETMAVQHMASRLLSTSNQFLLVSNNDNGAAVATGVTLYSGIGSGWNGNFTVEADTQQYPRFDFTAKELSTMVRINSNTTGNLTITVRDNGADSALLVTYGAAETGQKVNSSDSFSVTSGSDEINYELTNNGDGSCTVQTMAIIGETASGTPTAQVLVIGGGGGGGKGSGGGGGAGGFQYDAVFALLYQSYSVTVGSGGAGATVITNKGDTGGDSIFSTITSVGGGGGGSSSNTAGANGGSGGGARGGTGTSGGTGTVGQGNDGGDAAADSNGGAGGGGGAGAVGGNNTLTVAGNGGNGTANSISGASVTYAGGGGGGARQTLGTAGTGGTGGGGNGTASSSAGANGTANLGAGGGGGGDSGTPSFTPGDGGNGGSGVVIIRYATADYGTFTGGTITTDGLDTIHTFTASGTFGPPGSGVKAIPTLLFMGVG